MSKTSDTAMPNSFTTSLEALTDITQRAAKAALDGDLATLEELQPAFNLAADALIHAPNPPQELLQISQESMRRALKNIAVADAFLQPWLEHSKPFIDALAGNQRK